MGFKPNIFGLSAKKSLVKFKKTSFRKFCIPSVLGLYDLPIFRKELRDYGYCGFEEENHRGIN